MFTVEQKLELRYDGSGSINIVTLRRSIPHDSDNYIRLSLDNYHQLISSLPTLIMSAQNGKTECQVELLTLYNASTGQYMIEEKILADVTPTTLHIYQFSWQSYNCIDNGETFEEIVNYLPLTVCEVEKLIQAQEKFERLFKEI
jgi:hypothetical protein